MVSRWTKQEVQEWFTTVHGGDYAEHADKFARVDGIRLLSFSRDEFKEIAGAVDGIVLYKAVCAACSGVAPRSSAAELATAEAAVAQLKAAEEEDHAAALAAEDKAATEAAAAATEEIDGAEDEEGDSEGGAGAEPANPTDNQRQSSSSSTEPSPAEFEAIKRRSAARREAKLLAKRRPHHSMFTNAVFWNFDVKQITLGSLISTLGALLWPVWMRPASKAKRAAAAARGEDADTAAEFSEQQAGSGVY